jgi:hypothetical protein
LVRKDALSDKLAVALIGEEVLISLLEFFVVSTMTGVKACLADEASLAVVIWDLTYFLTTHHGVGAN